MRTLTATVALALTMFAAGCGPKRHVVVSPDEVPGRKGDTWHVTGEPSSAPRAGADEQRTIPR